MSDDTKKYVADTVDVRSTVSKARAEITNARTRLIHSKMLLEGVYVEMTRNHSFYNDDQRSAVVESIIRMGDILITIDGDDGEQDA